MKTNKTLFKTQNAIEWLDSLQENDYYAAQSILADMLTELFQREKLLTASDQANNDTGYEYARREYLLNLI